MAINFKETLAAFAVGRRVNMEEWNTITRTKEGPNAGDSNTGVLGFGQPAVAGTGSHTCLPLSATGQNVLGITEASQVLPHVGDNYEQYDSVGICESGVIGVLLGKDVAKGAAARFDISLKVWTDAAQSSTVATIPGAQFDAAGKNGEVGVVRYRRPVPSLSILA